MDGGPGFWTTLVAAIGLALFLEGAAYALLPEGMRKALVAVLALPAAKLRAAGLTAAGIGALIVFMALG